MLHLPQTRSYVSKLVPNQQVGKHNCTRPSGMYVTVASDQQPCLYNSLLTVCNAACLLQFHFISIYVLLDFSLTVKAATLIFISGRGLAIYLLRKGNQVL